MTQEDKSPYQQRRDAYIDLVLGEKAHWADKTSLQYLSEHHRVKEIVELLLFNHSKEIERAWWTGRGGILDALKGQKEKITLKTLLVQTGFIEKEQTPGVFELE